MRLPYCGPCVVSDSAVHHVTYHLIQLYVVSGLTEVKQLAGGGVEYEKSALLPAGKFGLAEEFSGSERERKFYSGS